LPFSIGIAGRPYNSVSTTVLHCNLDVIPTWHNGAIDYVA